MKTIYGTILVLILSVAWSCETDDMGQKSFGVQPSENDETTTDADGDEGGWVEDDDSTGQGNEQGGGVRKQSGCSGMDILFVIDDSGSMQEEQENLANNFPEFVAVLDKYRTTNGTSLDYRLGVTTTGVNRVFQQKIIANLNMPVSTTGPTGLLLGKDSAKEPNCGLKDPWLENTDNSVTETFSCMAQVGTMGSGTEMPFAAMEAALGTEDDQKSRPGGPNEGFYRRGDDSLLVVVFITDEDDCSIEKNGVMFRSADGAADCSEKQSKGLYMPADMKAFLDKLTGGEDRYVVVGIAGPNECTSEFGSAMDAKRVRALVEMCGDNGVFGNICEGNLWTNLEQALETMTVACTEMGPVV